METGKNGARPSLCMILIVANPENISKCRIITGQIDLISPRKNSILATMSKNQIWVDADACPRVVKDILFRAAKRLELPVTLVANQPIPVPKSRLIKAIQVEAGFDVADNYIVQHVCSGDLIITADIPLAAELVEKDCAVINPRGELYTSENIRERLNMRDFMDSLRSSGIDTGGPASLSQTDRRNFANQLDRLLTRLSTANKLNN